MSTEETNQFKAITLKNLETVTRLESEFKAKTDEVTKELVRMDKLMSQLRKQNDELEIQTRRSIAHQEMIIMEQQKDSVNVSVNAGNTDNSVTGSSSKWYANKVLWVGIGTVVAIVAAAVTGNLETLIAKLNFK